MDSMIEQVRVAAYHRWERRGGQHGWHDVDWLAAEQQILFARNYQVLAHFRLDGAGTAVVGRAGRRVCRFCEQAEPRTRFTDPAPVFPEFLGLRSVRSRSECDECRETFRDGIEGDFERFVRGSRPGSAEGGMARAPLTIGALKYLTRLALAILPDDELDFFSDAVEWVVNPDHDLDGDAFGSLGCLVHPAPGSAASPYAALARRAEDDEPFPYMLFFLGAFGSVFELAVPLCVRDQDLDDGPVVPRVAHPIDPHYALDGGHPTFLPAVAQVARRARLSWMA